MELEVAIPLSKIRFNKICMNYSLRIMQLFKNYPIKTRVSGNKFPPFYSCEHSLSKLFYLRTISAPDPYCLGDEQASH